MHKITLPAWAFVAVAVGSFYVYNALNLNARLPMPGKK
jgi:hypothetical protein